MPGDDKLWLVVAFNHPRQFDHDAAAGEIDRRHHRVGERQQQRRTLRRRDLNDVAGAEIMDREHAAERIAIRGDGGEPDQIGVVIFVVIGRGQFFARDVEFDAVEALGLIAGRDALEGCDQMVFRLRACASSNWRLPSLERSGP